MQHIGNGKQQLGKASHRFMAAAALAVACCAVLLCAALSPANAWARTPSSGEFYYTQLTADEKIFYDSLLAQRDEFLIDANTEIVISVSAAADFDPARPARAFFLDHPEVFWVDPSKLVFYRDADSANKELVHFAPAASVTYFRNGFDPATIAPMKSAFDQRVSLITLGLTGTSRDKAEYLRNLLCSYNAGWRMPHVGGRASSAYAALVDLPGSYDSDGFGFASAYKCLLDAAGIPNAIVQGVSGIPLQAPSLRAWNAVRIAGSYYAVDASWDADPVEAGNMPCFLAGSSTRVSEGGLLGRTFAETHGTAQTTVSSLGLAAPALAETSYREPDPVAVDALTFPDDAFREWLCDPRNVFGGCADGVLTASEAANVTELDVSGLGISSLKGLELFPELRVLNCADNSLTALDLSSNAELVSLDCSGNAIVDLDLSACTHLEGASLDVSDNMLTRLVLPLIPGCTVPAEAYASQHSAEGFLPPRWHAGSMTGPRVEGPVPAEGQTLVAVREAARYLIEFDPAGGDGAMEPVAVAYGSTHTVPTCGFTRIGYRFAGWSAEVPVSDSTGSADSAAPSSDESATEARTFAPGTTVRNLTARDGAKIVFRALWEPVGYTVFFEPGSAEIEEGASWPESIPVVYDESFELPSPECEDAARFVGWCADEQGAGHIHVAGSRAMNLASAQGSAVKLYAIWADDPLAALRAHALAELEAAYQACDPSIYTSAGKAKLDAAYAEGVSAIRASVTLSAVDSALASATGSLSAVQTKSAAVASGISSWRSEHAEILSVPVARAADMDAIVSAINAASSLSDDAEVQREIDMKLAGDVTSLTAKREVAGAKTLRLETLKGVYDSYDLSSFSGEGAAKITTAYQEGVRAIDAAASVADVETATESARIALLQAAGGSAIAGGPAMSPFDPIVGPGPGDGGQAASDPHGNSSFFLLLFLICAITALCVVYANVRDKRRARRR